MAQRFSPVLAVVGCLSVLGLFACDASKPAATSPGDQSSESLATDQVPTPVASAESTVSAVAFTPTSCADELGATAAEARAKICRNVSPATHPPCNVANSCAMIDDEIARSCALFDGQGSPMPGCTPAPKSSEAAAAVILRYYSALNAHDYETAWQQWGEGGAPNQTLATFTAGFAHTKSTHVTIGKLEPAEGAAGSIYQTVPVVVDATLDNGTRQQFKGDYTVRRVNGVDGASAAQLRWHIGSAQLTVARPG